MLRLLIGQFALCDASLPARSDAFTFKVRSLHPNAVQIKFHSQTRKGHQGPTSRLAWELLDDDVHALSMTCNRGERICCGAWVKGSGRPEWGAGTGGTDACKACCYVCINGEAAGIVTPNVRMDGDRVVPTQTLSTAKPARPPKRIIID